MATERNGIREYSRIRPFLTYIYLYGFLSREDFVNLGWCGPDEYDYCTRLLRTILPNISDSAVWKDGKKHLRFDRRYEASSESQLANSYLLHTIKNEELCELLRLLSCLARGGATQSQLQYAFEAHAQDSGEDKTSTFNRRRKELQDYGYVVKEKKQYRLKTNPLRTLSDDELHKLNEYIGFCAEITYPRVAGSFLKRCIRREFLQRGFAVPKGVPFLLRHNDCSNVFEEDIVYQLQSAIDKRKSVVAHFRRDVQEIIPLALRIDTRLGRWYLLYWKEKPRLAAVRNISKVEEKTVIEEDRWKTVEEDTVRTYSLSGCSGSVKRKSPYMVRVALHFEDAPGMYNQFRREIRIGSIIKEEGTEFYQILINDPVELKPLLRQYAPWLTILPGEHDLDTVIRQDLEEMRQQLEGAV